MRRRFVIGVDGISSAQEDELRSYMAKQGAWWHWIGNMWLLTTRGDEVSAEKIRDFVLSLNPKAKVVVFEFPEDITWASSGTKNSKGKVISDWLGSPWGDE